MRKQTRKMTDDPVVLRIMDQLAIEGKTEKELVRYLGLSDTAFSSWKFQNVKTFKRKIDKIAEFLNVSIDYLMEGTDENVNKNTLTGTEMELINIFRSLGNEEQKYFLYVGKIMMKSTKYDRMNECVSKNKMEDAGDAKNV